MKNEKINSEKKKEINTQKKTKSTGPKSSTKKKNNAKKTNPPTLKKTTNAKKPVAKKATTKKPATIKKTVAIKEEKKAVEKTKPVKIDEEKKEQIINIEEKTETSLKNVEENKKEQVVDNPKLEAFDNLLSLEKIFILIASALTVLLLCFYLFQIQKEKEKQELETSYLLNNKVINNEIKSLDQEISKDEYFIFINTLGEKDNLNLEKEVKVVLENNNSIKDKFYYFDATELQKEENYLETLKKAFQIDQLEKIPAIIYYRNGKYYAQVKRDDQLMIQGADLQKLIDIYEIK